MTSLAHWCSRRRLTVVGSWIALLLALAVLVLRLGTGFTDSATLPDSESSTAYSLLAQTGAQGKATADGATETGSIAWHTDGTAIDDPVVQRELTTVLDTVAGLPGVESVVSPYAKAGAAQLNTAANTAYAAVVMAEDADVDPVIAAAQQLRSANLDVEVGGTAFTEQPGASGGTEAIGILAALAILLLVFRSFWAALLPIITGVTGVGVSLLLVMLASHQIDLAATSLTMGALIGLGVGIDYALFIVNRHRKALMTGAGVEDSIAQAVNTSGRAVIFAGTTVITALLGMFVVRLGILTGMGQAAAVTVLFTVAAAITLLPALLSLLGLRVLSRAQRRTLSATATATAATATGSGAAATGSGSGKGQEVGAEASIVAVTEVSTGHKHRAGLAAHWAGLLHRAPRRMAALALLVIVVLASPVLSMRVGDSDASSDPSDSASHAYYELMADGFGDGFDATLLLVARTPDQASAAAFTALTEELAGRSGVSTVSAAPIADGQQIAVASVVPTSSAQTEETADLVATLRDEAIPAAEAGTGLQVYVGGTTATSIDISDALISKLPLYLGLIAVLGFLLLVMAFRSVLVPLVGAISNIATIVVGLGVITAIFQFGWGTELLGVGTGAPVMYLIPILIVGIMFGLSMDYQVFLVSRMHEEWTHTKHNTRAIRVGLTETAQVIAAAAIIMLCVFASFGFSGERIVASIGIGLGVGVVVDAFVVRMTLIPALMTLMGRYNWSYPGWAERITPRVSIEGPATPTPTPAPASAPASASASLFDA